MTCFSQQWMVWRGSVELKWPVRLLKVNGSFEGSLPAVFKEHIISDSQRLQNLQDERVKPERKLCNTGQTFLPLLLSFITSLLFLLWGQLSVCQIRWMTPPPADLQGDLATVQHPRLVYHAFQQTLIHTHTSVLQSGKGLSGSKTHNKSIISYLRQPRESRTLPFTPPGLDLSCNLRV